MCYEEIKDCTHLPEITTDGFQSYTRLVKVGFLRPPRINKCIARDRAAFN